VISRAVPSFPPRFPPFKHIIFYSSRIHPAPSLPPEPPSPFSSFLLRGFHFAASAFYTNPPPPPYPRHSPAARPRRPGR